MHRLARQLFALTAMAFCLLERSFVSGPWNPWILERQGKHEQERHLRRATATPIATLQNADPNVLLYALEAGDREKALELLRGPGAEALLRRRSRRRDCTPLMLAAGASGEIYEEIVECILAFGSAANVAAKSRSFRTAADYAAMHPRPGSAQLARRLKALATEELAKTADKRCPCCGAALLRRPRVASLADRYRKGGHTNPLLQRFFKDWPNTWEALMGPEFHTFHKARSLHKELSESLAALEELQELCPELQQDEGKELHLMDLCCGKSLTCALAASRFPKLTVSGVDFVGPEALPHYEWAGMHNVEYLQQDVLAQNSTSVLSHRIAEVQRPTAIIGIHLCGRLSERAVELFALEQVTTCILVPCCLPHLRQAPASLTHLYRNSIPDATQYAEWASYLQGRLMEMPGAVVQTVLVPDMMSEKRLVLTATKRASHCVFMPRMPRIM